MQEKKDEDDPDFGVVLAAPLSKGETTTIKIAYSGKDVVLNEGNGNYYPVAREDWYPNSNQGLGDYATYHMLFHVPKGLATDCHGNQGEREHRRQDHHDRVEDETPLPVVGFSLGRIRE